MDNFFFITFITPSDILVCLVTLDAQSLGADAFLGIKIIDPNPEGIHQPHSSGGVSRPGFHHAATPPPPAPTPHHPHQVTPGSKSPGRGGKILKRTTKFIFKIATLLDLFKSHYVRGDS